MKYEGLKCDVCEGFEAHKVRVVVTRGDKEIYSNSADLCNGPRDCIERLLTFISRGLTPPTPRKKGAETDAAKPE